MPDRAWRLRQDPAVAARVEQRQGEALVAAGLLERVVADEPDALEGLPLGRFEDGLPGDDLVDLAGDRLDLVEMGIEHSLEAPALGAAGQAGQPGVEPARPPGESDDSDEQDQHDHAQTGDEGSEVRLDERVEIDPRVLRWVSRV